MHAAVRYLADHDPAFVDEERRDQPGVAPARAVNQEDLLAVLMTFTTVVFGCRAGKGSATRGRTLSRSYISSAWSATCSVCAAICH